MKTCKITYNIYTISLLILGTSCGYQPLSFQEGKGNGNSATSIVRLVPPPGWSETINQGSAPSGKPFRALMYSPALWSDARENIDYLGYYCAILNDNFKNEELQEMFLLMNNWSLELSLEVTTVKWFPDISYLRDGRECFLVESGRWNRFIHCGAQIRELTMDEPLTSCVYAGQTMQYAVQETANWIELTRGYFGNFISLSLIEAYPRNSVESLLEFIDLLNSECEARGIQGIDTFTLDFDWAYAANDNWIEVVYLNEQCNSRGLPFCLIYWPSPSQGQSNTDEDYYVDIMTQGQKYEYYGGSPDIFCIQSWSYIPRQMVPEDEFYSLTSTFNVFCQRYIN